MIKSSALSASQASSYGLCMALITCVLWGLESVLVKIAGVHFSSGLMTVSYFSLSALAFGAITLVRGYPLPLHSWRLCATALLGGVCLSLFYYLFVEGVRRSGPVQGSVILQSEPFFVAILSALILKEHLRRAQVFGATLAAIGFLLFGIDRWSYSLPAQEASQDALSGNILVLIASFVWSIYALCQRALCRTLAPTAASFSIFLVGALLVVTFIDYGPTPSFTPRSGTILLVTSLMALAAYAALSEALGNARATAVTLIANLNPLVTISAASILSAYQVPGILPEHIAFLGYVGICFILLGSYLVARAERAVT